MARPRTFPSTRLGSALQARGQQIAVMAKESGVSTGTLCRLEQGQRSVDWRTAKLLAAWLGWTAEEVMEGACSPTPDQVGVGHAPPH